MEQYFYITALLISIFGLFVIDRKYKLCFWENKQRATLTILLSILVFILWDLIGISLGIFFSGNSRYMMPYFIIEEFPVEELFFLFLLSYSTLTTYQIGRRLWPRT